MVLEFLRKHKDVKKQIKAVGDDLIAAAFWAEFEKEHIQLILPLFEEAMEEAVLLAVEGLPFAIEAEWELVNAEAADWARKYTYDLISGIHKTTRKRLQVGINNWIEAGETFPDLVRRVQKVYSNPIRAEMIAATEITRVYAEANTRAWEASGVVEAREWQTAADERVCFPAWTMVETKRGAVPIQWVRPGMLVQTRLGWRPVEAVSKRPYAGRMVEVEAGSHWVCATADHPFWTLEQGWLEGINLKRGHRLQTSSKQAVRVDCVLQFSIGDTTDVPAVGLQVGGFAGIPFGVLMPVDSVNFQGHAEIGQEEINTISTHLGFLDITNAKSIKGQSDLLLWQGFSLVRTIASEAAELAMSFPRAYAEFLTTVFASGIDGWAATLFRAKAAAIPFFRNCKYLPAPLASLILGLSSATFPTAKGIAVSNGYRHLKNLAAFRTDLFNLIGPRSIIASTATPATALGDLAGISVDQFATSGAWDFLTRTGTLRHIARLLTKLTIFYHRWRNKSIPVYDIQVGELPEFFANGLLVHNCPICGPLQGQQAALGQQFEGGFDNPPAHPRCRCWVVPVVM